MSHGPKLERDMNATRKFLTAFVATTASALALSLAATAPARAADGDVEVSNYRVHFGDLKLDTAAGAKVLYTRLNDAAYLVCGPDAELKDLVEMRAIERCQQRAIEKAVAQVNRPQLTALYDSHYPRVPLTDSERASLAYVIPTVTAR